MGDLSHSLQLGSVGSSSTLPFSFNLGMSFTVGCFKKTRSIERPLRKQAAQCLEFEKGQEELLRATPIADILHMGGRILANSAGSASTYALSKPVDTITFLSHNWITPRYKKFFCWALHFRWRFALIVSGMVLTAIAALTVGGYLLILDGPLGPSGVWGRIVCPVFLLALVFGHELQWGLGYVGVDCFLDKTCIHQTDDNLKKQGVEKLGAFMAHSKRMVICYSDVYLRRLWTVYEVACFLLLYPPHKMVVVPVGLPFTLLALIVLNYMFSWLVFFLPNVGPYNASDMKLPLQLLLCVLPASMAMRVWARERHKMSVRINGFEIKKAECFRDGDKQVVQGNIHAIMKCTELVREDASVDETLDAFNEMVRKEVPRALVASLGVCGVPYHYMLIIWLLDTPVEIDMWAAQIKEGMPAQEAVLTLMNAILLRLTAWPLLLALISSASSFCLNLRGGGVADCSFVALIYFPSAAFGFLVFQLSDILLQWALKFDGFVVAFIAWHVALGIATFVVFFPWTALRRSPFVEHLHTVVAHRMSGYEDTDSQEAPPMPTSPTTEHMSVWTEVDETPEGDETTETNDLRYVEGGGSSSITDPVTCDSPVAAPVLPLTLRRKRRCATLPAGVEKIVKSAAKRRSHTFDLGDFSLCLDMKSEACLSPCANEKISL